MKIDGVTGSQLPGDSQVATVETLESRLLQTLSDDRRPNPEFDQLYQQLLAMEGQGEGAIFLFIKSQVRPDGTPAYPTAKAILAVTHQLLVRLKAENLEKSLLYQEIRGANGRAFSVDIFISGYLREVFQPMDGEAWEKSEW